MPGGSTPAISDVPAAGDSDARAPPSDRDDERFAQDLAGERQRDAPSADRTANSCRRDDGLREQQVGDVEARDGQDQGDRAASAR